MNVLDLVASLTLDSSQYDQALKQAANDAASVSTGFERESGRVAGAVATIGGAIVGNAALSVKAAAEYESAFTGVMKTINVDEFEGNQEAIDSFFKDLREEILLLTREMPLTAKEIAGIGEVAGQLGINNSSLIEFIRTIAMMGSATNLSTEQAAMSLARFANVTKMSQGDFDKLGSVIVSLGNNTATTEKDIVYFMQNLATLHNSAGLSAQDIAALAATMSATGAEASSSASTFEMLALTINGAVGNGGDKLYELARVSGMTAEEFSKTWREKPMDALLAFITGLDKLDYATSEQMGTLETLGLKQVRYYKTLLKAAGANETLRKSLNLSKNAWKANGETLEDYNDLQIEFIKRNGTLESKWAIFKNSLKEIAINAGEALIPALKDLLDAMTPVFQGIADFIKKNPEVVTQMTEFGLALLGVGTATGALSRLNGVLNRTTLIVAGIVAVVGLLFLYRDEVREFVDMAVGRIQHLADSVRLQFQNIHDIFENLDWGVLARFVGISLVAGIADGINAGIGLIEDALTNIVNKFNSWVDGTWLSGMKIDLGKDKKVNLPQFDTSGLHAQADELQPDILKNGARERIDKRNADLDELAAEDTERFNKFTQLFTGEREVKSFEERWNESFFGKILNGIFGSNDGAETTEEVNDATQAYSNFFDTLTTGVKTQEQQPPLKLPEEVPEETTESWGRFKDAINSVGSALSDGSGGSAIQENLEGIGSTINQQDFTEESNGVGTEIVGGIVAGLGASMALVGEKSAEVGTTVENGITPVVNTSRQWGSDLISNFTDGILSSMPILEGALDSVAGAVDSRIGFSEPEEGPLSKFHTFAPDMMQLFAKGIRDNSKMLANTVSEAFDFTKAIATSAVPSMAGLGGTNYGGFTFNVYGSQGMNEQTLARMVSNQVRDQVVSLGAVA